MPIRSCLSCEHLTFHDVDSYAFAVGAKPMPSEAADYGEPYYFDLNWMSVKLTQLLLAEVMQCTAMPLGLGTLADWWLRNKCHERHLRVVVLACASMVAEQEREPTPATVAALTTGFLTQGYSVLNIGEAAPGW
jgi:hypothetical protein